MLALQISDRAIAHEIQDNPPEFYPERFYEGVGKRAIMTPKSQPLQNTGTLDDGGNIKVKVGDFGHGKELRN